MTKHSYKQKSLELGFTFISHCSAVKVQCVPCYKVLLKKFLKNIEKIFEYKEPRTHEKEM